MSSRVVGQLLAGKSAEIFITSPDASVQEALELMVAKGVSSLPVVQGNRLVGIISERDYIRKAVPRRAAPWDLQVRDLMTAQVICVSPSATIQECMERMSGNRIRHLPVLEGERLIGILSITDVVRALRPARIDFPE